MKKSLRDFFTLPFKILFSRFTLALLALAIQIAGIALIFFLFQKYLIYFIGGIGVLNFLLVILIINRNSLNADFKTSWIILILLLPPFGSLFYLFCQNDLGTIILKKRLRLRKEENRKFLPQNEDVLARLKEENRREYAHAFYLNRVGHNPVYESCDFCYFPLGNDWFKDLLVKLREAKEYIFIEIFILANEKMWGQILEILEAKVAEGVEVRVLYDGTCSLTLLPRNYPEQLRMKGIKCKVFNPIVPLIKTSYNNRDHRKIVVIDGEYAYTGGCNIADEYINQKERFGHWKDSMVRLSGDAVNSFCVLFLEMWNIDVYRDEENYAFYQRKHQRHGEGYLICFGDDPLDNMPLGKETYLHILENAHEKVDIIMPYFVVDGAFLETILHTALKGIQIRLILPGIPDKKLVNYVAKTYYRDLLSSGIEIYEYSPGFTHAKMMLADGDKALFGTINLDYRSFYLHFEDGVYLYKVPEISKISQDFEITLKKCQKITKENFEEYSKVKLLIGRILRLFGPLL